MNSETHIDNPDCLFCKIVSGEIQSEKVYEDTETLAIMNINPTNKGQVLVMPKDHVENIYGFSEELAARIMLTAKKLSIAVKNGVDADGVNLIMNNEESAGQVIFHAHIHIIPRFNDDGLEHWPAKAYLEGEITDFGDKIKKEL